MKRAEDPKKGEPAAPEADKSNPSKPQAVERRTEDAPAAEDAKAQESKPEENKQKIKEPEAKQKKYAFFPGCYLSIRLPHLEKATRKVFELLGLEMIDIDFTCCPSSAIKDISKRSWLISAAYNLALCEEAGVPMLTVCNECYQSLKEAKHELDSKENLAIANKGLKAAGKEYKGSCEILHIVELVYNMKEALRAMVKRPLDGYRIAVQNGCHLLRPSKILNFDSAEVPAKLEEIIRILGAMPVDYPLKTLCCGNAVFIEYKDASLKMVRDKLDSIRESGGKLMVTPCQTCFVQFDRNQLLLKDFEGFPVIYFSQLLGIALGLSAEDVFYNLNKSRVDGLF